MVDSCRLQEDFFVWAMLASGFVYWAQSDLLCQEVEPSGTLLVATYLSLQKYDGCKEGNKIGRRGVKSGLIYDDRTIF